MLATLVHLLLVVALFAALGSPTLTRQGQGPASLTRCVVAGVLTLTRLDERRQSRLGGHDPSTAVRR